MGIALQVASLGLGLLGAVTSARGANQAAKANASNARYQAQVASYNAQIAQQNAVYEAARGEKVAAQEAMRQRQKIGTLIAAQGANGLDVNSGSNLDVRIGAGLNFNEDIDTIKSDAARNAYNFRVAANNSTATGQLLNAEATQDINAGHINATASLLSGAAAVGTQAYQFGVFSGGGSTPAASTSYETGPGLGGLY